MLVDRDERGKKKLLTNFNIVGKPIENNKNKMGGTKVILALA